MKIRQIFGYLVVALLAFFITREWYKKEQREDTFEETQVIVESIRNMSKLIVTEGVFSEIYNYENAKKYFYDTFEFKKSAIVAVNARVQVVFDLEKMEIEVDSVHKKIIIRSIPEEEINIIPEVKYYDIQQSTFNTFDRKELNQINQKSIEKIRETAKVARLKDHARERLIEELRKIYRLSSILGWEVVDETDTRLIDNFVQQKPKF
jgi:hypothetical protein